MHLIVRGAASAKAVRRQMYIHSEMVVEVSYDRINFKKYFVNPNNVLDAWYPESDME